MRVFHLIDAALMRVIRPVLIFTGLLVAVILAVGIFFRAVLGVPVFGLEEVMLFAVMWFYMLGAALASRERSHLSADFMPVITKNPTVLRVVAIIANLISLGIAIMIVTWAYDLVAWGIEKGQSTPVFAIPMWIPQLSLLVASVLFVGYLVRDLIHELSGGDHDTASEQGGNT